MSTTPPATNLITAPSGNNQYLLLKVPDFGDPDFVNKTPTQQTALFPAGGTSSKKLTSFLRLGSFSYDDEPPAAKELLAMIPQANASSDPSVGDAARTAAAVQILPTKFLSDGTTTFPSGNIFVDDVRKRAQDLFPPANAATGYSDADPNPDSDHGLLKGIRQAESAKLYSRGGWRDHSDGNRISTTFGDKVEVVRGNYKMIVLGRHDNTEQAMGWEASGGHIQDFAPGTMPGASCFLEWIDDYRGPQENPAGTFTANEQGQKGVWLLVNTTENVYEYARNAGNFREEVWGDVNETYVGSENPPANGEPFAIDNATGTHGHEPPHRFPDLNYDLPNKTIAERGSATNTTRSTPPWTDDNSGCVRSNPHIIEKTWARRIDSWTGSSARPVPHIEEHTFATTMKSYTGSSSKRVESIEEETYAKSITSQTGSGSAQVDDITDKTYAEWITELVDCQFTIASNTRAGAIVSATSAGAIVETTEAPIHISNELSALAIDMYFGGKVEFDLAAVKEITLVEHSEYKTSKQKTALVQRQMNLSLAQSAMSSKVLSVDQKMQAVSAAITALSTQIGI